jgi:hypothetical protein
MDPMEGAEISERDQLWASLRALRPEIARLGTGEFDNSERDRQMIILLARIVGAELDYRTRDVTPE